MATVAQLRILLVTNTQPFTAGLKKAANDVTTFNQQIANKQRSFRAYYQTQARLANRSFEEQATRDQMAAKIKEMRRATMQQKVDAEVQRRLFGDSPAGVAAVVAAGQKLGEAGGKAQAKGWYAAFLDDTKSRLGKRSAFGETMDLLKGGGVIAGFTIAANEVRKMTDAMVELSNGTKTWRDVVLSVPIIGQGWAIGQNLREMVTHEERMTSELLASADAARQFADAIGDAYRTVRELRADTLQLNREALVAGMQGLVPDAAIERLRTEQQRRGELESLREWYKTRRAAVQANTQAPIDRYTRNMRRFASSMGGGLGLLGGMLDVGGKIAGAPRSRGLSDRMVEQERQNVSTLMQMGSNLLVFRQRQYDALRRLDEEYANKVSAVNRQANAKLGNSAVMQGVEQFKEIGRGFALLWGNFSEAWDQRKQGFADVAEYIEGMRRDIYAMVDPFAEVARTMRAMGADSGQIAEARKLFDIQQKLRQPLGAGVAEDLRWMDRMGDPVRAMESRSGQAVGRHAGNDKLAADSLKLQKKSVDIEQKQLDTLKQYLPRELQAYAIN